MRRFCTGLIAAAFLGGAGTAGARIEDETEACDLAVIQSFDYCEGCQILVEKDALNAKGEHVDCGKKPVKADFCVKVYYLCAACGKRAEQAGKCPACQTDLMEQVSKSKILFHCKECRRRSDQPKSCDQEGCPGKDQPYVQTCADSGNPPHSRKK